MDHNSRIAGKIVETAYEQQVNKQANKLINNKQQTPGNISGIFIGCRESPLPTSGFCTSTTPSSLNWSSGVSLKYRHNMLLKQPQLLDRNII